MEGYVDISPELLVELLKGLTDVPMCRRFTVERGIPDDAKFSRVIYDDPIRQHNCRVFFHSEQIKEQGQMFSPMLTAHESEIT